MKKRLLLLIGIVMLLAVTAVAANKKFTLVIDAGHGGNDKGAIGSLTTEKNINLNVTLAFGRLVERNCPDVKVIYTRKSDVFIPLHTRADIANRNKADLFISIHTNSLPKGRIARGLETYTLGMHRAADNLEVAKRENAAILIEDDYKQRYQGFDPTSSESYIMFEFIQDHNMAQSVELAKFVQKHTCASAGRQNKGVKQAGFLVLRETSMPSCLIELGFISTAEEERFLNSSDGVDKLARGIYQAFLDYKKKYDKSVAVSGRVAAQPAVEASPVVSAKQAEKEKQAEKKMKRAKSKMAQELADAREGKVDAVIAKSEVAEASTDSILMGEEEPVRKKESASKSAVKMEPPAKVAATATKSSSAPVFKLQILASTTKLKKTDAQLKGQQDADCYEEGGLYKYTLGASEDYSEIYQLRKLQQARFPQAFIIAFRDGQKMDVQEAIREYKSKKENKGKK